MDIPSELRFTKNHEWARIHGQSATIGITAFAVEQLGDITMVELPEVGDELTAGEAFGTVESVKSVSDLYAPVSGTVTKINEALEDEPERINGSPYGDGWLVKVSVTEVSDDLLDASDYGDLIAEQG